MAGSLLASRARSLRWSLREKKTEAFDAKRLKMTEIRLWSKNSLKWCHKHSYPHHNIRNIVSITDCSCPKIALSPLVIKIVRAIFMRKQMWVSTRPFCHCSCGVDISGLIPRLISHSLSALTYSCLHYHNVNSTMEIFYEWSLFLQRNVWHD